MVNIDELLKQRADLQVRYAAASSEYQSSKGQKKRKAKKVMNELEDQLKRIDKLIYDANLSNQGIDSKSDRIDSIGSSVSDSLGHIAGAVSNVYGGQFGKYGQGAAEIAKQGRIAATGKLTTDDKISDNKNLIMIVVGAFLLVVLMFRKK